MQSEREFVKDRVNHSLTCESQGEYILPDYNSDIKKILFTEACAVPSGKFFDADTVEYTGAINYSVVYLDNENNLSHTTFSTDYELKTRCDRDKYVDSDTDFRIVSYTIRPIGPRRLLGKATLETDEHILEREEYTPEGDALKRDDIEVMCKNIKVRGADFLKSNEREYADILCRIDGAIADEIDVILLKPRVVKSDTRLGDNEYTVSGEIRIDAVVRNGEEMPIVYEKTIPFSETLPFENARDNGITEASVDVLSCTSEVNPEENGVYISVSLITETKLCLYYNESLQILSDCYLKENECENKYRDIEYEEISFGKRIAEQISGEIRKKEIGADSLRNIIYSDAVVRLDRVVAQSNAVVLEGKAHLSGIACEINEAGAVEYSGVKFDLPFRKNVNLDCQIDINSHIECSCDVTSVFCECDNDKVYPSLNVNCSFAFLLPKKTRVLASSATADSLAPASSSLITVYYPEREDTLFEVAKRFHTSVSKVAVDNALTENVVAGDGTSLVLSGVDFLIIKP